MAPIPRMNKPVCLIENCADGLSVNEDAQTTLANISQPLVVVSIVGPYRSGKSYLLNRLSGQPNGVFSVDPTIKANTKGIWMWCMPHPVKPGHTLVLLDTEGLGDPVKGDEDNDCVILSLAMLMSSAVIYNSVGVINQDVLEKLFSTLNLHRQIIHKGQKVKAQGQEVADKMSPLFIWVIRDFTLKPELGGRSVTADKYLEDCLKKDQAPKTPKKRRQNDIRDTINVHLPNRKCFFFGFPTVDKEVLGSMSQLPESELAPEFVGKAKEFCEFVLREASEKKLGEDQLMTGAAFAQLLKSFVDVVTRCDMAHLVRSISNMTQEENQRSMRSSTESYEHKMKGQQFNTEEAFQRSHERSLEEALREFEKSYVKHEKSLDEYIDQLKKDLLGKREELWKMCEDSSLKKCQELFEKLKFDVDKAVKENIYHVRGGYDAFVKDKDNIIQMYNEECDKGIKAEEVLKKLSDCLEEIGNTIPKASQSVRAKNPKRPKKIDPENCDQLSEYIHDYQLPAGQFDHILIQLFGYCGHGKSSFVNSCLYVLGNERFKDWAGEGSSYGGKTLERKAYELTDAITIVDNRGFAKLEGPEAWEIYAQLCNFAPLNEKVEWNKSFHKRSNCVLQKMNENQSPSLIVPVFVCSSEHNLSGIESSSIKAFLKKAHDLTGILPFVVLTKSKQESRLSSEFARMGVENICSVENYIVSNHTGQRHKHLQLLNFMREILLTVDFLLKANDDFQSQQSQWGGFLMNMANDI